MNKDEHQITSPAAVIESPSAANDTARQTPTDPQTQPAIAGHGAPQPAMSQPVAPENPGHSATTHPMSGPMSGYVTLDDVARAFEQAGIVRARRTYQRYCETGMLEAIKSDTLSGPQYFVLEASVPRAIQSVKALEMSKTRPAAAGESAPQPAMSQPVAPSQPTAPQPPVITTPSDTTTPGQFDPAMARYVERLEHDLDRAETENDKKNEIIHSLIERDKETNTLTQGLQKLLTPLLARVYGQDFMALDDRKPPSEPRKEI